MASATARAMALALVLVALMIPIAWCGYTCGLRLASRRSRWAEHVYSVSFHASPVPLVLRELATGRAVDANDAWSRFTGWSHSELLGTTAADLEILCRADVALVNRRLTADRVVSEKPQRYRTKGGEHRD